MEVDIQREFHAFEEFLAKADRSSIVEFRDALYRRIGHIADLIHNTENPKELEEEFFHSFDRFDLSPVHRRAREKPLGYAGDFLLIDWIYTQKKEDDGEGRFFDALFHSYEAARSVRNRKKYFILKCQEMIRLSEDRVNILNVGCGPCRDVQETLQTLEDPSRIFFHCIDHEPEAIQYASKVLNGTLNPENVHLECTNCFKLKPEMQYDLIWSAGLFDYLEDRIARLLLKKLWRFLKDGGQIIFGNFSPKNPTRTGMELGCHWNLLHRTAGDLTALCQESEIPFSEIEIESEPLGINLFCIIKK